MDEGPLLIVSDSLGDYVQLDGQLVSGPHPWTQKQRIEAMGHAEALSRLLKLAAVGGRAA